MTRKPSQQALFYCFNQQNRVANRWLRPVFYWANIDKKTFLPAHKSKAFFNPIRHASYGLRKTTASTLKCNLVLSSPRHNHSKNAQKRTKERLARPLLSAENQYWPWLQQRLARQFQHWLVGISRRWKEWSLEQHQNDSAGFCRDSRPYNRTANLLWACCKKAYRSNQSPYPRTLQTGLPTSAKTMQNNETLPTR